MSFENLAIVSEEVRGHIRAFCSKGYDDFDWSDESFVKPIIEDAGLKAEGRLEEIGARVRKVLNGAYRDRQGKKAWSKPAPEGMRHPSDLDCDHIAFLTVQEAAFVLDRVPTPASIDKLQSELDRTKAELAALKARSPKAPVGAK